MEAKRPNSLSPSIKLLHLLTDEHSMKPTLIPKVIFSIFTFFLTPPTYIYTILVPMSTHFLIGELK